MLIYIEVIQQATTTTKKNTKILDIYTLIEVQVFFFVVYLLREYKY